MRAVKKRKEVESVGDNLREKRREGKMKRESENGRRKEINGRRE